MKRKNATRSALLMSIISLLLCVSMLVGTTFAWFTDEVTSGINQIAAGNLDVELYHGKSTTPSDKVDSTEKLFTDFEGKLIEYWEPGVVAYTNLQVANVGTLALKYQMALNFENESKVAVDGTEYGLSEVLKVALVEGGFKGTTRAEAHALFNNHADAKIFDLASFTQNGVLKAEETTKTYGIVVYWEPGSNDYDNIFNLNNGKTNTEGGKTLSINLGINLFATQVEHEADSFDKNYDQVGTAVFTVAEANELLAKNEDVTLVNCIEPNGIIYIPANYDGTLTLNNVTIASMQESAAVAIAADGESAAAPVATPNNIVILGNVVVKATEKGMSAITGTKLNVAGSGHLTAVGKGAAAFGIGGMTTESITITDVTIDYVEGGEAYGVGSDTKYYKDAPEGGAGIGSGKNGAVINLNSVTVTKAIGGSKAAAVGARYHTGVTVNISGSTIGYAEGGVSAAGIGGSRVSGDATESGTTINITNSTVAAKGGAYGAGIGSGYDTHCLSKQPLCTINITDSTINATGGKYAAGVGTGYHNAALAGEIKNSTVNAVSGEKWYKDSYTVAMNIGFGVVDPTREGQQTDSYIICNGVKSVIPAPGRAVSTFTELQEALAAKVSNITLAGDIQATEAISIGYNATIHGDGYTISRAEGYTETVFSVGEGAALTLANVTVDGGAVWATDGTNTGATTTGNLVAAGNNATITLNEGAILQNNDGAHAVNLGTRIGATLTLNGGEIINNRSGSGAVWGGGNITVNSGKISHNTSTGSAGAIRMVSNCNLTMNGGEISNNTAAVSGGAIWGYGASTYNFTGGEMSGNTAAAGGAIYTGDSSTVNISGTFEMCNNKADEAGAMRLSDRTAFNMSGGKLSGNISTNAPDWNGFYGWNPSVKIFGGELADDVCIQGGLTPTIASGTITGVIHFDLSTNHNTANLAADFGTFKFTVAEDSNFSAFNLKPATGYTYTEGDEAKLICMNEGYETHWDATSGTYKLQEK